VKINDQKLRERMEASGVSAEDLSSSIAASPSEKQQKLAKKKVANWLAGRNHPAARASEIASLAEVMGCEAKDLAKFTSKSRWVRSSPQKARLVIDMIRGHSVDDALSMLEFSPKRAAVMARKALDAAIADAEGADADVSRLVVSEAKVDGGMIIKRFQPKDRGRAHPIQKKTSHITVSVEEVG
jgi:large subunit ribosomal protein L22